MRNAILNKFKDYYLTSKKNKKLLLIFLIMVFVIFLSLMTRNNFNSPKMELLVLFITIFLGIFCINYYTKHDGEFYKVAFCIILCFGIVACLVTPIFDIPDENEHFIRSELTSRGEFIPNYNDGFDTIQGALNLFPDQSKNLFDAESTNQPINYTHTKTDSAFEQNPFYGYLAQGLGVGIAKLLNLNSIWMLWFGRIANLILYATLVAIAIRKTPILKIPMLAVACMPLAIYQSASLSIDSLINGLALIIFAYIFYMFKCSEKTLDSKDIAIYSILTLLLSLCRTPFCILILFLIIIPKNKFKENKNIYLRIIAIVSVILITLVWSKYYAIPSLYHSFRVNYYIENNVNPNAQMNYILKHPVDFINLVFKFPNYSLFILKDLNNFSYASNNYMSPFVTIVYVMFLGAITFLYPRSYKIPEKYKYFSLIVLILFFYGNLIVQLLSWTTVGKLNGVSGAQPRYFIPFFILLPFIFNFNDNKESKKIDQYLILLMITFIVVMILTTVVHGY